MSASIYIAKRHRKTTSVDADIAKRNFAGRYHFGIHCIYKVANRYEWDEKKNRANRAKHGITFTVAARVFLDPNAVARQDREVDGEQRWQTIGFSGAILTVAYTVRDEETDEVTRIISARKATPAERRVYEESDQFD
jgi:uncharacterized protein